MLDRYHFHKMTITWLDGVDLNVDGNRLFGPVPKSVWKRYAPYDENNFVPQATDPILIQYNERNYLIDASLGLDKMTEKQQRNEGVQSSNRMLESLKELNLSPEDIHGVLLTHAHNDHMGGLTFLANGELHSTFPNATIYLQEEEWEDLKKPAEQTSHTYLRDNWEPIAHQVETFQEKIEIVPNIEMIHTGGHTRGFAFIKLTQQKETILHLGDQFPSVNYTLPNPTLALEGTKKREKWLEKGLQNHYTFIFYHDPFYRLATFNKKGSRILHGLNRSKSVNIPLTKEQDQIKHVLYSERSVYIKQATDPDF